MKPLSTHELLSVWETSNAQGSMRASLALLAAAEPETPIESLADLSIGERDRRLLSLREWAFGPRLASVTVCPQCDVRLDLDFSVSDIRADTRQVRRPLTMKAEGYEITFRLINSTDIEVLPDGIEPQRAKRMLLERCILQVLRDGAEVTTGEIPENILEVLDENFEEADSQANIQLRLECPACGHGWMQIFDVVSFFWHEIESWAVRLFREVDTLARAYGWREADILSMSPQRRRIYLDMHT